MVRKRVTWLGRARIIMAYAPPKASRAVQEVTKLARLYAQGELTKRQYLTRVKAVLRRYGLSEREWKMIYRRIKAKKQV